MTLKEGPTLPKGHQTWHDERDQQAHLAERDRHRDHEQRRTTLRTASISKQFGVIKKAPTAGAYRTDLAKKAVALLKAKGLDVNGLSWKPETVTLTAGGK